MKIGIVIPYRGTNAGKSRLRESMDEESVKKILSKMTQHVITEVMKVGMELNLYILTRKSDVLFDGKFQICKDEGRNLNDSLKKFTAEMEEDIIMVLMADLPLIKHTHIEAIVKSVNRENNVVVAPAGDNGTSILCFNRSTNFPFFYGKNSALKFANYIKKAGINNLILETNHCYQDIDTLKDLKNLNHSNYLPKWLKSYIKEVL
ncbi:MAG: 2-phospho-L-lactate guanylyltransferase [Candidatus Heimdallarchaeota archaeon]|nr:2-phospho-L-lactate guanylyltransferase [Candidatus Heimdallarchaeota archaeon]